MYIHLSFIPDGPVRYEFDAECIPGQIIFRVNQNYGGIDFHLKRKDLETLRDGVVAFLADPR